MSENWATAYSSGPCAISGLDHVNVDECIEWGVWSKKTPARSSEFYNQENYCKVTKIKLTKKITVNIYNEEISI